MAKTFRRKWLPPKAFDALADSLHWSAEGRGRTCHFRRNAGAAPSAPHIAGSATKKRQWVIAADSSFLKGVKVGKSAFVDMPHYLEKCAVHQEFVSEMSPRGYEVSHNLLIVICCCCFIQKPAIQTGRIWGIARITEPWVGQKGTLKHRKCCKIRVEKDSQI